MKGKTRVFIGSFTIIEVVVAIAIFGMSLVGVMGIIASSGRRMNNAVARWEHQHMLSQAIEYYLLEGAGGTPPSEIFDYEGYSVSCEEGEPVGLPEGVEPQLGEWRLVKYIVTLKNEEGDVVDSIEFEKIVNDSTL